MRSGPLFYPRQGMSLRCDPDAHQFMIRRVVDHLVNAIAEAIVRSQFWCQSIGQHAQVDRLWFAQYLSELARFGVNPTPSLTVDSFLQRTVAIEKIVILQR